MQISHGETPWDTGKVLSRYGHAIAIRNCFWKEGNRYIREVAKPPRCRSSTCSANWWHPCQARPTHDGARALRQGRARGPQIAVSWAYAPSYQKPMSVPQSLIALFSRFGMDVVLAHRRSSISSRGRRAGARLREQAGTKFEIVHDMDTAVHGAHVVYPKSWGCMMHTRARRIAQIAKNYTSWICDERRMRSRPATPSTCIVCRPTAATR